MIREIGVEIGHFFTEPGVPWTLYAHGHDWVPQIGGPASALVAAASADGMRADDRWQGVAATAYRNTLPRQAGVLAAVSRCAAIDQLLANDNAFPGGHWPRPSIDLSDGSITDGDGTDWHIKI